MDVKTREERLARLRAMGEQVRIGGKGSARRKKKIIHKNPAADDKKVHSVLKRYNLNPISAIEEVNMYKTDGTVIHFKNPEVKASVQATVFSVSGQAETKPVADMFPMNLGMFKDIEATKAQLEKTLGKSLKAEDDDDDVPDLVEDFDEKSKLE